jgi:hypothetical protein
MAGMYSPIAEPSTIGMPQEDIDASEDIDRDSDNLRRQSIELKNIRYKSNTDARNWMSVWTAVVVSLWLFAIMMVVVCNGSDIHLSDNALIALLTTSTVKVIGLPYIVLRGLFNEKAK